MSRTNEPPTAKRILSLLVDLLADQYGVKVSYVFDDSAKPEPEG